ncbi:MAG: hypothetical protein JRE38_11180 [Deltaproteobacteria bacterium]|nr:hypothetical protein [Deltaproteobacteria bacterium]MBW2691353.1 hypothetical protein [Deltaproteobacteria bacterium]
MYFAARRCRRGVTSAIAALALVLLEGAEIAAATATAGELDVPPPVELRWRSVDVGGADKVVIALALDRAGRLAVGDARGVVFGFPGNPMRRVALRGEVRDLAFFGDDTEHATALLAATDLGLYRISSDGRVESIAPGPGPDARAVARIAVANGVVVAATDAGAFVSPDGAHWQRLSEELPSGSVTAIALAQREGFVEAWIAIRGELWRSEIRVEAGRAASSTPVRVEIPFASGQRPPIDIALDVGDAEVAVVFESDLVVREAANADWEQLRPTLPPGASALRLAAALDRYWLATDRGLLVAPSLRGPWRRAHNNSGSDAIFDLETGEGALYAATDTGLAVARFAADFSTSPDGAEPASDLAVAIEVPQPILDPSEPDVHSVHRAALRYLSLDPGRIASLRRGVSRRGWLPILSFRATRDRNRSHHWDYDQSFVSGEMRHLYDRDDDDDRDLELQLIVSWDLGEIVYHPEEIDVSREAREIIELRDDVLDEITQLYFERRRVIAAFAMQPDSPAASEYQLRAAQLAAGIDAWTGGWFGRQLSDATP